MTDPYQDKMFYTLTNLTLCVGLEIDETISFIESEYDYRSESGHETQVLFLSQMSNHFQNLIANPFRKTVLQKVVYRNDGRIPDAMDYLFAYSNLPPKFFKNFHKANQLLRKHFFDGYRLPLLNKMIDQCYPGIEHNEDLYPHHELNNFFLSLAK